MVSLVISLTVASQFCFTRGVMSAYLTFEFGFKCLRLIKSRIDASLYFCKPSPTLGITAATILVHQILNGCPS